MRKGLGVLTLLAAGLLAGAWMVVTGGSANDLLAVIRPNGTSVTIEFGSFAMGVAVGVAGVWISRIPWSDIPRAILGVVLGWRRNVVLAGFAVACTGVLLFY